MSISESVGMGNKEELRRRNVTTEKLKGVNLNDISDGPKCHEKLPVPDSSSTGSTTRRNIDKSSFWLTRVVVLRCLGFVYFIAFLVALHQNKQLIGKNGLLPAHKYLNNIKNKAGGISWAVFSECPSIIWLFDYNDNLDLLLDSVAWVGLTLSVFLIVRGAANWFIMLALWILNHSTVNIGQKWYGFGWETQLLETGFLATFLCPVWSLSIVPKHTPTSVIVIWSLRWLLFRRILGAGLIKIRGDNCWRALTCMNYHYETQPVPNPMSYYLHQSPEVIHMLETLGNHFIELVVPFFFLMGQRMILIGGAIQVFFQVLLIVSGNLSFLNWLTIVPCLACFDDRSLSWIFSACSQSVKDQVTQIQHQIMTGSTRPGIQVRRVFNILFGVVMVYLSIPVIKNLMSSRQKMNQYYNPLRIINTYGAFGSVTRTRTELIFQGTSSSDPNDPKADWLEYEFKCKPGNTTHRPCVISPYHYRLDWLVWVAAFQRYRSNEWLSHVAVKLLVNDEGVTSLLAGNPFKEQDPPKFIRIDHYQYTYTRIGSREAKSGAWWKRKRTGNYLPPISLKAAQIIMKQHDWDEPGVTKKENMT